MIDLIQSLAIIGLGVAVLYITRAIGVYRQLVLQRMDSVTEDIKMMCELLERQ